MRTVAHSTQVLRRGLLAMQLTTDFCSVLQMQVLLRFLASLCIV